MVKKIVSSVALSALTVASLHADKVSVSTDGLGDFLVAPMYIAKKDTCSNVTVMNTNETNSILAKVTFREQLSSQEVDLPIFLSPGDVWDGEVCETSNGVVLTSSDDSNHPSIKNVLLNGKSLTAHSYKAGHENVDFTKGYVEIYPIAQFNENSNAKVNKDVLVKRWDALMSGDTSDAKLRKEGVNGYSLSGTVTINNATLPMMAFKGTHDKQVTGSAIAYSNDTSPELLLGKDNLNQVLKLLQKNTTSFTYNNGGKDQYINFTFPFSYAEGQSRTYKVTVRDMSENKDIKKEKVVIFSPAPLKKKIVNSMTNEVTTISIADIIGKTTQPSNFRQGIIQIKEVINNSNVQLGEGNTASFIAIKSEMGTALQGCNSSLKCQKEVTTVNSISYVPSK